MKEIWKPVVGFNGQYEVSNLGRIRSVPRKFYTKAGRKKSYLKHIKARVMRLRLNTNGYPSVNFNPPLTTHRVHVLVAAAFIGPKPFNKGVCHNDGNPANNRVENLRYGTQKENLADKILHGTHNKGSRHGNSKLKEAAVVSIRKLAEFTPQNILAKKFRISRASVSLICSRKAWRHV